MPTPPALASGGRNALEAATLTADDGEAFPAEAASPPQLSDPWSGSSAAPISAQGSQPKLTRRATCDSILPVGARSGSENGSPIVSPPCASSSPVRQPEFGGRWPPVSRPDVCRAPCVPKPQLPSSRRARGGCVPVAWREATRLGNLLSRCPACRFGEQPWPTAPSNMDRRPSHARFPYTPTISNGARKLYRTREADPRERVPASERLYRVGIQQMRKAESRAGDALDLGSFDYAVAAGLEEDGVRGEKVDSTAHAPAPPRTHSPCPPSSERVRPTANAPQLLSSTQPRAAVRTVSRAPRERPASSRRRDARAPSLLR